MEHALREVGMLVMAFLVGAGPVCALLGLLNLRDRREAALFHVACGAFSSETVRSDVAIRVRCRLLRRGGAVAVDLRACSPAEVWGAMARLRAVLPPSARLHVQGTMGRSLRTQLTVERLDAPAAGMGRAAAS
jgi:hypothetical protein